MLAGMGIRLPGDDRRFGFTSFPRQRPTTARCLSPRNYLIAERQAPVIIYLHEKKPVVSLLAVHRPQHYRQAAREFVGPLAMARPHARPLVPSRNQPRGEPASSRSSSGATGSSTLAEVTRQ